MAPSIHFVMALLAISSTAASLLCPAAHTHMQEDILQSAKSVLDNNWVEDMHSTLPSPNLYPHQWSWDAAFVAIGYSHYDTLKAIDETDALFRGQWKNGLLPHIVFNPSTDESYFPGPSFWQTGTSLNAPDHSSTSGIIQPPVHAIASISIYKNALTADNKAAAMQHLHNIYPKLASWHEYLYRDRDPLGEGLVFIRHMWESGMDNSPAWDAALDAMKLTPDMIPIYKRCDKGKVGHDKERPTSYFYDRAVYLIKIFFDNKYDEAAIFEKSPFVIQDVLFNSILARAGSALAEIASILGKHDDARMHSTRAAWTATAITSKLYDTDEEFFFDYDMVANRLIKRKISGGLVALYGANVDSTQVSAIIKHLYSPGFLGENLSSWTIPSVAMDDPGYTNSTYWKGPAWLNINYLVREGLQKNAGGNADALKIADFLMDRSIEMISSVGFYEYFNPMSGSPHGGHQFSWSAALTIDWICSGSASPTNEARTAYRTRWGSYLTACLGIVVFFTTAHAFVNRRGEKKDSMDVSDIAGAKSALKRDPHLAVPRGAARRLRSRTRGPIIRRST